MHTGCFPLLTIAAHAGLDRGTSSRTIEILGEIIASFPAP
jgi:hypothetical protein